MRSYVATRATGICLSGAFWPKYELKAYAAVLNKSTAGPCTWRRACYELRRMRLISPAHAGAACLLLQQQQLLLLLPPQLLLLLTILIIMLLVSISVSFRFYYES